MSRGAASTPPPRRGYGGITAAQRDLLRREKLVQAAIELFGTDGYPSTSVEAICARGGVSTRNFYDHFANREDLLLAVYDHITAEAQAAISVALALETGDAARRARAGIAAFVGAMLSDERRARINFIEVVGASQRVEAHRRQVIRGFAHIIEQGARELMAIGAIQARDELHIPTIALVGAVQETLADWVSGTDRAPLDLVIDELVRLFAAVASS